MKDWLDSFLSEHLWYRKWRGGKWYRVRQNLLQDAFIGWVRTPPIGDELLIEEENY
jgi:hypothetical protein